MKIDNRQAVEIIGVLAVVASLLFVGYELRLSRSIAQSEGFIDVEDSLYNVRTLQIDNIDVWRKSCLGEELSDQEKAIAAKIFELAVFRRFSTWSRANIGLVSAPAESFARGVALQRFRFPGFNRMWIENYSLGMDLSYMPQEGSWQDAVESIYLTLNDQNTKRDLGDAFCY